LLVLEETLKFLEGEVARLSIEKYNFDVLFNSPRDVNNESELGFKSTKRTKTKSEKDHLHIKSLVSIA